MAPPPLLDLLDWLVPYVLVLAMICVSLANALRESELGLRLPPRIGRPSPNAKAEPETASATTTTLANSQGPFPELRKRLRMRLSIGWRPSWRCGRSAPSGRGPCACFATHNRVAHMKVSVTA